VRIAVICVLFLATATIEAVAAPPWRPTSVEVCQSIRHSDLAIYLPVKIGAIECLALVDTGASITFVDKTFASASGPRIASRTFRTAGDPIQVELRQLESFSVAGTRPGPHTVGLLDLEFARQSLGKPVACIVGMDFLRNFVLYVNMDAGTMHLCRRYDGRGKFETTYGFVFDEGGAPCCCVTIADQFIVSATLDTGCFDALTLQRGAFHTLMRDAGFKPLPHPWHAVGADGRPRAEHHGFTQVGLLGLSTVDAHVSSGSQSLAGIRMLNRCIWLADFPNKRLYLSRGEFHDASDRVDNFGMSFVRTPAGVVVTSVSPRSAAAEQGIREGDILQTLGDIEFTADNAGHTTTFLGAFRKEPVPVAARRNGKPIAFQLGKP
jgi:hypothetical protein